MQYSLRTLLMVMLLSGPMSLWLSGPFTEFARTLWQKLMVADEEVFLSHHLGGACATESPDINDPRLQDPVIAIRDAAGFEDDLPDDVISDE